MVRVMTVTLGSQSDESMYALECLCVITLTRIWNIVASLLTREVYMNLCLRADPHDNHVTRMQRCLID